MAMSHSDPHALLDELTRLERLRDPDCDRRRRRSQRLTVRGDADLLPSGRERCAGPSASLMLRDMSRSGFGFVADRPLAVNSKWRLRLLQRGYDVAEADIIVRHSQQVGDYAYLTGAQVCNRDGLFQLLGADPHAVCEGDHPTLGSEDPVFLPPPEP